MTNIPNDVRIEGLHKVRFALERIASALERIAKDLDGEDAEPVPPPRNVRPLV
jgi:hypothetical protein